MPYGWRPDPCRPNSADATTYRGRSPPSLPLLSAIAAGGIDNVVPGGALVCQDCLIGPFESPH